MTGSAESIEDLIARMRPRLFGLAYRMLASTSDADDAVQNTCISLLRIDLRAIHNPQAWLMTTCTRKAIDILRTRKRQRTDYVGSWLPEPLHEADLSDAEHLALLSDTLSTAFMLLLEQLSPRERTVFLLHDIFDIAHEEIAETLNTTPQASRQLGLRARRKLGTSGTPQAVPTVPEDLLKTFQTAILTGDPTALRGRLTSDVQFIADGGGQVAAAPRPVIGDEVPAYLAGPVSGWWRHYTWRQVTLGGTPGFLLSEGGKVVAAITFAVEHDRLSRIFVVRNPAKLARLQDKGDAA